VNADELLSLLTSAIESIQPDAAGGTIAPSGAPAHEPVH
jgi:hypothetical protein